MPNQNEEAEQFIKEAKNALSTSLFKWSPDYFTAAMNYESAANAYKKLQIQTANSFSPFGNTGAEANSYTHKAVDCLQRAATCYLKKDMTTQAAKAYEVATELLFSQLNSKISNNSTALKLNSTADGNFGLFIDLSTQINALYNAEYATTSPTNLNSNAKSLGALHVFAKRLFSLVLSISVVNEDDDGKMSSLGRKCADTYLEACRGLKLLVSSGSSGTGAVFHVGVVSEAVNCLAWIINSQEKKMEKGKEGNREGNGKVTVEWSELLEVCAIGMDVYHAFNQRNKVFGMCLSKVIIALVRNDLVAAKEFFTDSLQDSDYLRSTECEASEELINAFENRDVELFKRVLVMPVMSGLEREVVKFVQKILAKIEASIIESERGQPVQIPAANTNSLFGNERGISEPNFGESTESEALQAVDHSVNFAIVSEESNELQENHANKSEAINSDLDFLC